MRWKGQGEIRSGDYTVYYSGGERAERGVAIVVHKSIVRSVVKKIVCSGVIPCQVNQIFSTFEPDPLGFFSNLAHHMYHRR